MRIRLQISIFISIKKGEVLIWEQKVRHVRKKQTNKQNKTKQKQIVLKEDYPKWKSGICSKEKMK